MMRRYYPYLIALMVGILAGMKGCQTYYANRETGVQRDTIFVHDTIEYTKQVLAERTKVVHTKDTQYIYIETKDTIVKDNKVYVQFPIQHYRTKVKEAEIFHSGVESKIDSLRIFSTQTLVTEKKFAKEKKNSATIYGSVGYMDGFRLPVGAKYLYSVSPWWKVGAKGEYDFAHKQIGIYATTEIELEW
jgi:hypothetical protein